MSSIPVRVIELRRYVSARSAECFRSVLTHGPPRERSTSSIRTSLLTFCASLLAITQVAAGCGSEPTVDSGGPLTNTEGKVAFMRATSFDRPDIDSDVFVINVDGSEEKRLTDKLGLDGFPSWSPDGRRIAFASERDAGGNWELYAMNPDGTEQRRLTHTPDHDESVSAWSPIRGEDRLRLQTLHGR